MVYNYLDKPQTVTLKLADGDWFERRGDGQARSARTGAGRGADDQLPAEGGHVSAPRSCKWPPSGQGAADALKKTIEVVPDGRREEQVVNGTLQDIADASPGRAGNRHRGQHQGVREDLSVELQPGGRGAGEHLPAAARLLRADLLDDVSERACPGLPQADGPQSAGGGSQGPPVHPPGLPAAVDLRGPRRRLRLVRPGVRPTSR